MFALDDDQAEFDQQNGLLAKLLNDFLNEEKIKAALKVQPKDPGALNRLQQFLMEAVTRMPSNESGRSVSFKTSDQR